MTARFSTLGGCTAAVSVLSTVYFLVAASAAQVLNPQYSFVRDYISNYAIGRWGFVYGSAFWASSVGIFALAISLTQVIQAGALSRVGVCLLAVVGVTYMVDYFFPTDLLPPGAPPVTLVGAIHLAAALVGWVLFTVGAVLISSRLKHDAKWVRWRPLLLGLAWLSGVLLIVLVAVAVSAVPFGGLAEKAFILERNVWSLVVCQLIIGISGRMREMTPT